MNVAVLCGSAVPTEAASQNLAVARRVGSLIAESGHSLVFGGCNIGLMKELADSTRSANGRIVGVITPSFVEQGIQYDDVSEMITAADLLARQQVLHDLADLFVFLPGGLGTLSELGAVLVHKQLGLLSTDVILVNVAGHWDPMLEQLERIRLGGLGPTNYFRLVDAELVLSDTYEL